ncbi:MAG: hypothetical protein FJ276_09985 [Planctomycetes bacterium]|nr:hypothetical protein [Planctomycetota bacterium]
MNKNQGAAGLTVVALLTAGMVWAAEAGTPSLEELAAGFATPTGEAKPWVYWWFQGGYGDPGGMARDIAAMKEKGIGGVMHMQTINASGLPLPKEPRMLSPDWDAWFGQMLRIAREGGMTLSASILDGWAHGGWWVGKEDGAKQLVHAEIQIDGPATFAEPLPQPLTRLDIYRDVVVVAYREKTRCPPSPLEVTANNVAAGYCDEENWPAAHAADGDPESYWRTQKPCAPGAPALLEFRYARPVRFAAAFVAGMPEAGPAEAEIQVGDDGKTFRPVARFTLQAGERKRVAFAPVETTRVRLAVFRGHVPDLKLAEFSPLREGDEPVMRPGIKWWDFKSANRAWWVWPPNPYEALEEEYAGPDVSDLAASDVLDLTPHLRPDGRLDWQAPAGRWTVLRFGWTPLAEPARMGSGGYEVDILSTKGANLMMDSVAKRMRALSVAHAGGAPIFFHTDSWEIGAGCKGLQPTWTEDFRRQFQKRRGYDLLPYLPAMARRVVDGRETTNRFLRDYRDTVADLLADYYGHLQRRARELSGGVNSESGYGSYPHPQMDGLKVFGRSDRPMAEFWHPFGQYSDNFLTYVDVMRTTASGTRIYGNRFVQAETLTYHPWAGLFAVPSQYRRTLHEAWARGLNQAVIHKYTHQPFEEKPGTLDYDIFNRHFSWWPLSDGFLAYLGRCQHLLQQGEFVADAAYFVGEGASRFVPGKDYLRPSLPAGYDYDGINAEVLLTRASVKDGRLVLPNGPSYRYLVLCDPQCSTMEATTLRGIRKLVEQGLTLVGGRPTRTPGLAAVAEAELQLKTDADALWGDAAAEQGDRRVGEGRVVWGSGMRDILAADGVQPDVETTAIQATRAGLAGAQWVWHASDGDNPPPCERLFRATVEIPAGRQVLDARVSMTADNGFVFTLNDSEICRGDNFHHVVDARCSENLLRPGRNVLHVRAVNGGEAPNPAGLIGRLVITLDNGQQIECPTDPASWQSSADGDRWTPARSVGPLGCAPWGPIDTRRAGPARLAWIHRRAADTDIYFLANPLDQPLQVTVTLRAAANAVRLFDPLDGSVRDLPERTVSADGRAAVPLQFEPEQALFVVLGNSPGKSGGGRNFPPLEAAAEIPGPWKVTFDASWLEPLPASAAINDTKVSLDFTRLEDWSRHAEAGVKGYSGVATYRTTFDAPDLPVEQQTFLDLGTVKEMARVVLNGRDLGVTWCAPWRVRVPGGLLKERGNDLVISVANTWQNRLCADHELPEGERLTRVGHQLHAEAAKRGLQPAGLLGPVRLLCEQ